MTDFQILGNQIASDFEILAEDCKEGLYDGDWEGLIRELKRINVKFKLWKEKADAIIDEHQRLDKIMNSKEM